jgi:uncharacterized damage-inducible protein DinB
MSTNEPGISFRELLAYTDYLAKRWLAYFEKNPRALDIDVGGRTGSMRELVNHIFQVEQFFASRLLQKDPLSTLESPTARHWLQLHQTSHEQLSGYIASVSDEELQRSQAIGPTRASNRKILAQVCLHSVHTWAQVAIEVRQAGFPTEKPQDIMLTGVMK